MHSNLLWLSAGHSKSTVSCLCAAIAATCFLATAVQGGN